MIDHAKVRREHMRWTIMLTLDYARPAGAPEDMILSTVQGVYPDATHKEIRRELEYLDSRKLLEAEKQPNGQWRAALTHYGVDIVEYTVDCHPGIARPEKYAGG